MSWTCFVLETKETFASFHKMSLLFATFPSLFINYKICIKHSSELGQCAVHPNSSQAQGDQNRQLWCHPRKKCKVYLTVILWTTTTTTTTIKNKEQRTKNKEQRTKNKTKTKPNHSFLLGSLNFRSFLQSSCLTSNKTIVFSIFWGGGGWEREGGLNKACPWRVLAESRSHF